MVGLNKLQILERQLCNCNNVVHEFTNVYILSIAFLTCENVVIDNRSMPLHINHRFLGSIFGNSTICRFGLNGLLWGSSKGNSCDSGVEQTADRIPSCPIFRPPARPKEYHALLIWT